MNNEFTQIADRIREAHSFLCLTHVNPDGDGLGAMAALVAAARAEGKTAISMISDTLPARYEFLFGEDDLAYRGAFDVLAGQADLLVLLDTCSFMQLGDLAEHMATYRDKMVVIDHHAVADDIGSLRWMDATAAAAGLMTMELLEELGWEITPDIAEALAAAICSDTGWLRFSNTDSRCLRAVAKLLEAGVSTDKLYARIYQTDRPERLALLQRVLGSLEFHHAKRLAVMTVRAADFRQSGARRDETENLVNEALRVGSVEAAVLLVENGDYVRVSLRSRRLVDVSELAAKFGGGGHARAAGLKSLDPIDTVKARLIEAFRKELPV
ncbi:MAG: DHH family phosphoesterase [Phycisphaerae bacterium]|nr:DHH family phosphoesterase [Phycisphaerae bacterium]